MICDVGLLLNAHVMVIDVFTGAKVNAGSLGD